MRVVSASSTTPSKFFSSPEISFTVSPLKNSFCLLRSAGSFSAASPASPPLYSSAGSTFFRSANMIFSSCEGCTSCSTSLTKNSLYSIPSR